ncbi:MAG: lactonase family protein [Oscillospiraceae bacterium]|nr:lactonase family protein [Oscillospiraceae bacterium]
MVYSFYAGCYTGAAEEKGVHLLLMDTDSGELSVAGSFYGGESPSFLCRKGNNLYATNEIGGRGKISALGIRPDGGLDYLNSVQAYGGSACHAAEMRGFIYAANYSGGSLFGAEILPDGSLGRVAVDMRYQGSGPNPRRQEASHVHSVNPAPGTDLLIAADLGTDRLYRFRQLEDGALVQIAPDVSAPPGGGPRHLAFHPNGRDVYVVMEMGVSVGLYRLKGTELEPAGVYPLLSGEFTAADTAAAVYITAGGERLYASVRGQNLISAFRIGGDGALSLIGSYPAHGDCPRSFCFSPGEEFILIANQNSGNVAVCPVDPVTGGLGGLLGSASLPGVSCIIS